MVLKGIAEPKGGDSEPQFLGMSFGAGPRQVCCANGRMEDNLHREGGAVSGYPPRGRYAILQGGVSDSLRIVCMHGSCWVTTPTMHIIYAREGGGAASRYYKLYTCEAGSLPST